MSTRGPSGAPYIIICSGRIRFLNAKSGPDKLQAASDCAALLVSHLAVTHGHALTTEDTKPISVLQHFMMDNLNTLKPNQVKAKCGEMFDLLDALEDKFE